MKIGVAVYLEAVFNLLDSPQNQWCGASGNNHDPVANSSLERSHAKVTPDSSHDTPTRNKGQLRKGFKGRRGLGPLIKHSLAFRVGYLGYVWVFEQAEFKKKTKHIAGLGKTVCGISSAG
ncbi:hypothetical protein FZEAL_8414 [Fusarium zealandicum]|uniref:Uncharacterized protein n=1 Tax=Fusarium zealandicum TaxID=1053134 RepID=A0A8H4UDS5_9HYPO|nr:hypothetical protein FZEAL_8414 [Fusarium zealandicum]